MARSAMEALNRRFEEESGDTNVDIEVIVNADGEAAEDIIEAADAGETTAETEAIAKESEEATQEANDMAELAVTLRKYGLTPGMAAILKVTVPLAAYGISLPAMESLDSSGRNQAVADRIANRLEAAVESFWDSTKDFFRKMVNQIVRAIQWIWHRIGNIKTRVERAHASLQNRSWDSELAKDRKYKHPDTPDDESKAVSKLIQACMDTFKNIESYLKANVSPSKRRFNEDDLKKGIGYKYKDSSGDNADIESDTSIKLDFKEDDATEAAFDSYRNGAAWKAVGASLRIIDTLHDLEDHAKASIDKVAKFGDDANTDANKKKRDTIHSIMRCVSIVVAKVTKRLNKLLMSYVTGCSQLRVCTRPSHTE